MVSNQLLTVTLMFPTKKEKRNLKTERKSKHLIHVYSDMFPNFAGAIAFFGMGMD